MNKFNRNGRQYRPRKDALGRTVWVDVSPTFSARIERQAAERRATKKAARAAKKAVANERD